MEEKIELTESQLRFLISQGVYKGYILRIDKQDIDSLKEDVKDCTDKVLEDCKKSLLTVEW